MPMVTPTTADIRKGLHQYGGLKDTSSTKAKLCTSNVPRESRKIKAMVVMSSFFAYPVNIVRHSHQVAIHPI